MPILADTIPWGEMSFATVVALASIWAIVQIAKILRSRNGKGVHNITKDHCDKRHGIWEKELELHEEKIQHNTDNIQNIQGKWDSWIRAQAATEARLAEKIARLSKELAVMAERMKAFELLPEKLDRAEKTFRELLEEIVRQGKKS